MAAPASFFWGIKLYEDKIVFGNSSSGNEKSFEITEQNKKFFKKLFDNFCGESRKYFRTLSYALNAENTDEHF